MPYGQFTADPVFPSVILVGDQGGWSAKIINSGFVDGVIFLGINNKSGNPGSIVVTYDGASPTTINPGQILRLYALVTADPGDALGGVDGINGTIVFDVEGSYSLDIHAGHDEGTETARDWVTDQIRTVGIVVTTEAPPPPPPGNAQGVIEALTFPISVVTGENEFWDATVHNIGDTGGLAFGIVNEAGNPGDMVVTYAGGETLISPGYLVRYFLTDRDYCYRLILDGTVRFLVEGTYTVKLWGMHEEAGSWVSDDEQIKVVGVQTTEPPEEEPTIWEQIVQFVQEHPAAMAAAILTPLGLIWVERGRS